MAYGSKCFELLVFIVLMFVLVHDKVYGKGQIGKLPIFIVFLAVINSVFSIVRVNALFPGDNDVNISLMAVAFFLENISSLGAYWLFGIKYYETAKDIETVLSSTEDSTLMTKQRKVNWLIFRWVIFLVIMAAQLLITISFI